MMDIQSARKETKREDYAFWRQFDEKPSIIPGCPGIESATWMHLFPAMRRCMYASVCLYGPCICSLEAKTANLTQLQQLYQ